MTTPAGEIPCPGCGTASSVSKPSDTGWRCPKCSRGYSIRRCSSCQAATFVSAKVEDGQPWACLWCRAHSSGFASRGDPAAATQSELAHDIKSRGLVFADPEPAPAPDTQPVLIVTTNEIPGYRIIAVHGDVFGLVVRARGMFSTMGASLVAGGEASGYTKLLTDSRNQARQRMWSEARSRGANAIVGMRFDCNEIRDILSEVAAYGTAVTVEPLPESVVDPAPSM